MVVKVDMRFCILCLDMLRIVVAHIFLPCVSKLSVVNDVDAYF